MNAIPNPRTDSGPRSLNEQSFATLSDEAVRDRTSFWAAEAQRSLEWISPWTSVVESDFESARISWFSGGRLNVSVNCVDRHARTTPNKTALHWEGNTPGETREITYADLLTSVVRGAAMLRGLGVGRGDRVAIYLPMVPEAVIAMLACARIGAVHSVVFAGFSAESLRDRINDSSCKVLITADQAVRGDKTINLKEIADEAVSGSKSITSVVVVQRTGARVPFNAARDSWWDDLIKRANPANGSPESMDSEDPLFILYTSGSTGKPKGVVHTQAGYLLWAAFTHRNVFDVRPDDVHFCTADVGWITGHSYVVYGPLCNGVTTVLFEPTPVHPDAGRYWRTVQRVKATIFYTAPTAIRTLAKEGSTFVTQTDRSSIRVLGTVGEPINPDAWKWYFEVVGDKRCPVVDTWWQTETGGILISAIPGVAPLKPGSASRPLPGIVPVVADERGAVLNDPEVNGRLFITEPWPGIMRTVYGDHERFRRTYFSQRPGWYFTGDGCRRDAEGDYWITGRVDDVLNVSGHRLGTAEIEGAIVRSGIVAEAAVVGKAHEIKGEGVLAFCVLRDPGTEREGALRVIKETVRKVLSPIATPDEILFVPGLPKTRSGKIMRRILRKIGAGEYSELGDVSTLSDPGIVDAIVGEAKRGRGRFNSALW